MSPSLLDVAKQNPFAKPDANAAGAKLVEFGSTEVGFQISVSILIGWNLVLVRSSQLLHQFENLYKYYIKCCIGGSISCGLTHTLIVPLDLVKCRMQVDAAKYPSLGKGFKVSFKDSRSSTNKIA